MQRSASVLWALKGLTACALAIVVFNNVSTTKATLIHEDCAAIKFASTRADLEQRSACEDCCEQYQLSYVAQPTDDFVENPIGKEIEGSRTGSLCKRCKNHQGDDDEDHGKGGKSGKDGNKGTVSEPTIRRSELATDENGKPFVRDLWCKCSDFTDIPDLSDDDD